MKLLFLKLILEKLLSSKKRGAVFQVWEKGKLVTDRFYFYENAALILALYPTYSVSCSLHHMTN